MIGGQVLIIFVGGAAFRITPLDGREWGLSIGLGAISLPWGAAIRKYPDAWVAASLPWFMRKRWAPETISSQLQKEHHEEMSDIRPPLRTLTSLRGARARKNIHRGFRERMHDAKVHMQDKIAGSSDELPAKRA
jgi:P-type Ca2+ transporter type 2C